MAKLERQCGFCGLGPDKARRIIAGQDASICLECLAICQLEADEDIKSHDDFKDLCPSSVVKYLDRFVIGQDRAKKTLAVACWNHAKRSFAGLKINIQKSNCWLIGGSGTGKTLMLDKLAEYLDIPFASIDASTITEAGYVGEDPEVVISRLYRDAEGNVEATQKGIVFIDEFDKLAKSANSAGHRDIKGVGVQQSFLRMIEGDVVSISTSGKKKSATEAVEFIDTSDILFILGGAFVGIQDQLKQKPMGIENMKGKGHTKIGPKHLIQYGMIPELVGRVPVLIETQTLDEATLIRILTEPEDSITRQYQALLALDGVKLSFDDSFLKEVAKVAIKNGTGARGLRATMESSLNDLMYAAPERFEVGKTLPTLWEIELTAKDVKE